MTRGAEVQLVDVTRTFTACAVPVEVLRGVSLRVAAGGSLAVSGPSGCGKTTLLQIVGALDSPTSGEVRVNGREIGALPEEARARFRNSEVGFVFQAHNLLPQLTALENVLVPTWTRSARDGLAQRARALLDRVGLGGRADHFPGQLSGGERQRVAVARALVQSPGLILADEPTGALDHGNAVALIDLLLELNREEQTTLIVATHSEMCASRMERRVGLVDGKLETVK